MTLEELIIKIRADAKGVHSTLDKTRSDVKGVEDQAKKSKGGIGGVFAGVKPGAAVAAAGVAAGAAVVMTSINTYKAFGKEVKAMMRMTGASAEQASQIVGQMKLIGGEELNTADALGRWAVNLAAARDAGSTQGKLMAKLGIDLKNADGSWRSGADVLVDYREKMSGVSDATERAQDLQIMMGRGYRNILPWFTKSKDEIEEYSKALKDMGLEMTGTDMDTWGKYMADEKMMGMLMVALQIKIARLVIPTLNAVFPLLNTFIGWLTKIPAPLIKVAAGLAALWAAMKMGGAVVTMTRNIIGMSQAVGGLARGVVRTASALPDFVAGWRGFSTRSGALTSIMGRLGGGVRKIATGLMDGVRAAGKWIAKLPGLIAGNLALAGTYTAIAVAAAAAAVAVYLAVDAAKQMWQAENDLLAQKDANAAAMQAFEQKVAAKYGRGSAKYQQYMQGATTMNGGTEQFDNGYSHPWWWGPGWKLYDKVRGFANEGIVKATPGGSIVRVAEGGKDEAIVHADRLGKGKGDVHVHIGTVVGTDARAARLLARMVGDEIVRDMVATQAVTVG